MIVATEQRENTDHPHRLRPGQSAGIGVPRGREEHGCAQETERPALQQGSPCPTSEMVKMTSGWEH
jgi:hypothetical protein